MTRRHCIPALFALGLIVAVPAHAVVVNSRGEGQALIFPYFNTAAGNTSLLTLTNNTADTKVVRLRWGDGDIGRTLVTFHVYLGSYDSWSASTMTIDGGASVLTTADTSCTFPPIATSTSLPQLPNGRRYVRMPIPQDAGEFTAARTREGYVEAIEVATIVQGSGSEQAVNPNLGIPNSVPNCAVVTAAWQPGGYWFTDSLRDLRNPTGGLSGQVSITNIARGTTVSASAVALEDFRVDPSDQPRGSTASVVVHNARNTPGVKASLDLALSDPATDTAVATLVADGKPLTATYPASTRAIDAVSAVLSAARLSGEFDTSLSSGSNTSFVLTAPTRRFYTDSATTGSSAPQEPYLTAFQGRQPLGSTPGTAFLMFDRGASIVARSTPPEGCGFLCPPFPALRDPATAVYLVAPKGSPDPLFGTRLHADVGNQIPGSSGQRIDATGVLQLQMEWRETVAAPLLRASNEGYRLRGLPVIGMRLSNEQAPGSRTGAGPIQAAALPMTSVAHCVRNDAACTP